ncbi:MAG: hypothetical protein JJT87_10085 [Halomonas sp.]|nr:hypothetical protein [Halomonas sp.]MCC5902265.1 hypothetical protein [Halomonas sp.]
MATVCFIVDAVVTGSYLPRHLRAIRQSGHADHLLPIIVTNTCADTRLAQIEQRYQARGLVTPAQLLGARINQAANVSQAEWLFIALNKTPVASQLWSALYAQLETPTLLDALIILNAPPRFSTRLLRHLVKASAPVPPYLAIRRTWLERLGGFDPELDESSLGDLLQRLYACPTRLKTISSAALRSHLSLLTKDAAGYSQRSSSVSL